ncbi:MAG: Glu-tRNA(Gln) amidotransferase subunit GatE [Thaumarchaeota archaeon]|nr:Glu-tRNA(Gln) amidotransferase subunit GatE [Nitrososphaerota archaeon]
MNIEPEKIGLKVGLEVHQQLATEKKLFCSCPMPSEAKPELRFMRRLRPTQSEMGQIDPAALFEFRRGTAIIYEASDIDSCLVEADEEPPHDLNQEAVQTVLIIALSLGATPVDELHVMRKIVIDGSNTTGFQRTLVVALNGQLKTKDRSVPVQTICLEEDAARLLEEKGGEKVFSLSRLCVPLVEVALAPVAAEPESVQEIALTLGRLMRATGRVARGLGTIRQDVNVSVAGGGGVVEVKGVQRLDLISKIIEYEAVRQTGLLKIKDSLLSRGLDSSCVADNPVDVTEVFRETSSNLLQKTLKEDGRVVALFLKGFKGMLGYEPIPGIRLGRELAEVVRFYGIGGIFHSDELPAYGIIENDLVRVKEKLGVREEDGFIIIAGPEASVEYASRALIDRLTEAFKGVPSETRGPTPDGKTKFSRPRPGAARMYPETDIPPCPVPKGLLQELSKQIPPQWEEQLQGLMDKHRLNSKMALQIYDSGYMDLFEKITASTRVQPSVIAATLTETLVSLERQGLDSSTLTDDGLLDLFKHVDSGAVSKEAVPQILELLLKGESRSVQEAANKLGLSAMSDDAVVQIISRVIEENKGMIASKGEGAFSLLMGRVMVSVRGKADGQRVSSLLKAKIAEAIRSRV